MSSLMAAALGALVGAALVTIVFLVRQMRLAADAARLRAELEAAERAARRPARAGGANADPAARSVRLAVEGRAQGKPCGFRPARRDLLRPVRETLARVQAQLAQVDKAREGSYRAVRVAARHTARFAGTAAQGRRRPDALAALAERSRQMGRNPAPAHRRARRHDRAVRLRREGDGDDRRRRRQTPDLIVKLPGERHDRHRREGADRRVSVGDRGTDDAGARRASRRARAAGARSHPRARREGILEAVPAVAGIRRDVPAARAAARGGVRTGRHAAR